MCKVFVFFFFWGLRFVSCSLLRFAFTVRGRVARSCQFFVAVSANRQRSLPGSISFPLVVLWQRAHTGGILVVVGDWFNFPDFMWCQSAMHTMPVFTNRVGVLFLLIPVREMMRKVPKAASSTVPGCLCWIELYSRSKRFGVQLWVTIHDFCWLVIYKVEVGSGKLQKGNSTLNGSLANCNWPEVLLNSEIGWWQLTAIMNS